ncbi:MAG: hypothetical protein ACRD44_08450 [Bryobacteraceae bacterium]
MRRLLRVLAIFLATVVALYALAVAGVYVAMRQTPERFGAIVSSIPMRTLMYIPFKSMWMSARGGSLGEGDPAPDFVLPPLADGPSVTLSEKHRERPVVLIFGSYT